MNNYIYTNSTLILNKIYEIIKRSNKKEKDKKCEICKKSYKNEYKYKEIIINGLDIHMLKKHNKIDINLYNKVSNIELDNYIIEWYNLNTNGLNIFDAVYEDGSYKKYIEKTKNIMTSKVLRYSEHSGLIYFKNKRLEKVSMLNNMRIDSEDPIIYMPKNNIEALKVDYLFHTHPKTPYLGSRLKDGILYDFPSISDILHYVEHHNNGRLLGSIVLAPEGLYIIRKSNFDRKNIKLDYDIFIERLQKVYNKNYINSYNEYKNLNYRSLKEKGNIKIPDDYFYKKIANNYVYINNINNVLKKYDIYIDYYCRMELKGDWIFSDIYVPVIN